MRGNLRRDGPSSSQGRLNQQERRHVDFLRRRADFISRRIRSSPKELSYDRAELGALKWAIRRLDDVND